MSFLRSVTVSRLSDDYHVKEPMGVAQAGLPRGGEDQVIDPDPKRNTGRTGAKLVMLLAVMLGPLCLVALTSRADVAPLLAIVGVQEGEVYSLGQTVSVTVEWTNLEAVPTMKFVTYEVSISPEVTDGARPHSLWSSGVLSVPWNAGATSWKGEIWVWQTDQPASAASELVSLAPGSYDLVVNALLRERRTTGARQRIASKPLGIQFVKASPPTITVQVETSQPYYVGTPIQFSLGADPATSGAFKSFQWDFGDGTVSPSQRPAPHQYVSAGEYAVRVTAWTEAASTGETSQSLETKITILEQEVLVTARRTIDGIPESIQEQAARTVLIPGNDVVSAHVRLAIDVKGRTGACIVREQIPAKWVTSDLRYDVPDGIAVVARGVITADDSWEEWLLDGELEDGQTCTIEYELRPTADAEVGVYRLAGEVVLGDNLERVEVQGEQEILVEQSLAVDVAVAHLEWSPSARDCAREWACCPNEGGSGVADIQLKNSATGTTTGTGYAISDSQRDLVIGLWASNCPVPYTGGQRLTYEDVLRVLEWNARGYVVLP